MLKALNHASKRLSRRASQPRAELRYPPEGGPFICIPYLRWQFFSGLGESEWDTLFFTEDDGKRLYNELKRIFND